MCKNNDNNISFLIRPTIDGNTSIRYTGTIKKGGADNPQQLMEIERKFLINQIPEQLEQYLKKELTQGYLCTSPVVRIRQQNEKYILTYKSDGMRSRIEQEMPLTKDAFKHLLKKTDGNVIQKTRYLLPIDGTSLTIELDEFHGNFEGIYLAEVEFASDAAADEFNPPEWFDEEVTYDGRFHNSQMSQMDTKAISELITYAKKGM